MYSENCEIDDSDFPPAIPTGSYIAQFISVMKKNRRLPEVFVLVSRVFVRITAKSFAISFQ